MKANGTAASEKLPGSSAHRPGATSSRRTADPQARWSNQTLALFFRRGEETKFWHHLSGTLGPSSSGPPRLPALALAVPAFTGVNLPLSTRAEIHGRPPTSRCLLPPSGAIRQTVLPSSGAATNGLPLRLLHSRRRKPRASLRVSPSHRSNFCDPLLPSDRAFPFLPLLHLPSRRPSADSGLRASLLSSPRPPSLRRP